MSLDRVKRRSPIREDELHRSVAQFLDLGLPPEATYTTIPGGHRVVTIAPGYHEGWPDIEILWAGRSHYIELKRPGEVAKKHQSDCHERIRRAGGLVEVCHSLTAVERVLERWGIPVRARVAA